MNNPYLVRTYRGHREWISSIDLHPYLEQIVSSSPDASICVWNLHKNTGAFRLIGHKGPINDVQFSPNGAFIVSASRDETIKIWNNKPDGSFSSLKGHTASVNG